MNFFFHGSSISSFWFHKHACCACNFLQLCTDRWFYKAFLAAIHFISILNSLICNKARLTLVHTNDQHNLIKKPLSSVKKYSFVAYRVSVLSNQSYHHFSIELTYLIKEFGKMKKGKQILSG